MALREIAGHAVAHIPCPGVEVAARLRLALGTNDLNLHSQLPAQRAAVRLVGV